VLIIDDEPDVRESLRSLLGMEPGLHIEVAASFTEGSIKVTNADWDLIISDERLPDGSGTEILARVAQTRPPTRLALMSAHQDFSVAVRAINMAKIDDFIEKPWEPEELVARVRRMLQEGGRRELHQQFRGVRRIGPAK
jgi:DNA-binding NtrC family response regulator